MLRREFASKTVSSIPSASELDLLGTTTDGWDVTDMDRGEFFFKNTGAVSVTVRVYYSTTGTNYIVDTTTYTVTAGSSQRITLNPLCGKRIRLTAQAASSTSTGIIEGLAMRGGGR